MGEVDRKVQLLEQRIIALEAQVSQLMRAEANRIPGQNFHGLSDAQIIAQMASHKTRFDAP